MVWSATGVGKRTEARFRSPPWTRESPDWQALDKRLPADHLCRQIDRAVNLLDLSAFRQSYRGSGDLAYPPELLLKAVLYEIHSGRQSPAEWNRDARENDPLKWLLFGVQPSRGRWYAFRNRCGGQIDAWNASVLQRAVEQGITSGKRAAQDGTLIAARASRHQLVNENTLVKRQEELDQVIEQDEAQTPPIVIPGWMAKHPATRLAQQEKYQVAAERMTELQQENAGRIPSERRERKKVVVSVSDPNAALGLDKQKVFRPLYNVQFSCDLDSPLILAYEVFAQSSDAGTLRAMFERQVELVGCKPDEVLADAGYATVVDLIVCEEAGVTLFAPFKANDYTEARKESSAKEAAKIPKSEFEWLPEMKTYRCPAGHLLKLVGSETRQRAGGKSTVLHAYQCPPAHCGGCPLQQRCVKNPKAGRRVRRNEREDLIEALQQRMQTPEAKALYKLRRQTVELGFADFKEHRSLRRFSGYGLQSGRAEVGLTVLVRNLLAVNSATKPTEPMPEYRGQTDRIPEESPA
jgi:transposase